MGSQIAACIPAPVVAESLVQSMFYLASYDFTNYITLKVYGIGTVQRVVSPNRLAMHIYTEVLGVDPIVQRVQILGWLGISFELKEGVRHGFAEVVHFLKPILLADRLCLLPGKAKNTSGGFGPVHHQSWKLRHAFVERLGVIRTQQK